MKQRIITGAVGVAVLVIVLLLRKYAVFPNIGWTALTHSRK